MHAFASASIDWPMTGGLLSFRVGHPQNSLTYTIIKLNAGFSGFDHVRVAFTFEFGVCLRH